MPVADGWAGVEICVLTLSNSITTDKGKKRQKEEEEEEEVKEEHDEEEGEKEASMGEKIK